MEGSTLSSKTEEGTESLVHSSSRRLLSSDTGNDQNVSGTDDCCPICFGNLSVACLSNCRHWFCGSCILEHWNYSTVLWPCKCPRCFTPITKLTPLMSSPQSIAEQEEDEGEEEIRKVLESVQRYNTLYAGGIRGLKQKFVESPFLMKRIIRRIMDPDRNDDHLPEMRLVALLLGIIYSSTTFDFIPTGGIGIMRLFDYSAIIIVFVLRIIGIYQKRKRTQRFRIAVAAAAEQLAGDGT